MSVVLGIERIELEIDKVRTKKQKLVVDLKAIENRERMLMQWLEEIEKLNNKI